MGEEVEVESVRKFKWMTFSDEYSRNLIEDDNMWSWFMFGVVIPLGSIISGIPLTLLLHNPTDGTLINMSMLIPSLILSPILYGLGLPTYDSLLLSIIYWARDKPFRLIGAKAIFNLHFIPIIIAAVFNFLEFNYGFFFLILSITTYFYTIAHFMRIAYDIRGKDVMFGLVMLFIAFFIKGPFLVRGLVLSFCVALCIYRYVNYSAPQLPKELDNRKQLLRRIAPIKS